MSSSGKHFATLYSGETKVIVCRFEEPDDCYQPHLEKFYTASCNIFMTNNETDGIL